MRINFENIDKFSQDPEVSWTLPGRYYFDTDIYTEEMNRIFYNNWQYVCHQSKLQKAGDYCVREIGGQSVFVVRDSDGQINAYHNVCQHRAHRLVEDQGNVGKMIMCPYHNWCYKFSGQLFRARGSEAVKNFPMDEIALAPVKVDQICGFIFVHLGENPTPMSEAYPELEDDILALAPNAANLKCAHKQNFTLKANWKNSVENYSECYHCPNQHPTLSSSALDMEQYRIVVHQGYHRHRTKDVGDQQGYAIKKSDKNSCEFGSWFVWPNMVFEVYPGGNLTIFNHLPTAPEVTTQETEWYFPNEVAAPDEQEVIDFVNVVREEDIPLCESVQKGLHSQGYKQGRFIVDRGRTYMSEHAVHDFQVKVIRALSGESNGL